MANDIKLKLSRKHEEDVHELLGGHSSKSSGNQWHDAADGKTDPYGELAIAWDCKCCLPQTKSMSTTRDDLVKLTEQARGRKIAMPMRYYNTDRGGIEFDMIMIPLEDYVEQRDLALRASFDPEEIADAIRDIAADVDLVSATAYQRLHDIADQLSPAEEY